MAWHGFPAYCVCAGTSVMKGTDPFTITVVAFIKICKCRDTFYIESFHVVILIYAAKRIHFGDETYEMRVHLAV